MRSRDFLNLEDNWKHNEDNRSWEDIFRTLHFQNKFVSGLD
jgi:hypothetical protein